MQNRILTTISIGLTVVLLIMLQFLTQPWGYYWLLFFLSYFSLTVGIIIALRNDMKDRGVNVLILPIAYISSVFSFHLFVSQGVIQQIFILLATIGFFFLIARGIHWAYPTWNWFFTSVTFFLFTAAIYGLHFHLRFPLWLVVLSVGVMTTILSIHVLGRSGIRLAEQLFWSMLLALVISEFLGAFALLPLSYITVSGVLFVVFYICLHLLQKYIYDGLTPKIALEYITVGVIAISLVLGTAQWAVL